MPNKFTYINESENKNIEHFFGLFTGPQGPQGPPGPQGLKGNDLLFDSNYFDTSNNNLSLKVSSITPWNIDNNNLFYNNGNIGLGIFNPQSKLQVVGDISANRFIGSGSLMTDLNPNNINNIIPQSKGGTGVSFLDTNYFDTSDNKLSLRVNSIIARSQTLGPIYEPPKYLWEGFDSINEATSEVFTKLEKVGTTAYLNTNYSTLWNFRYMIGINNTTKTNSIPTNYLRIKLKIDPKTHNSVFIQTVTRDRWSSINMCICNPTTKVPVVKLQCRTNNLKHTVTTNGNSSFLGPNNEIAHVGHHEWLQFCIPKEFIDTYKTSDDEVIVSVNAGASNTNVDFPISGIASCANPYGVCISSAKDLEFATNGGDSITTLHDVWNEEVVSIFNTNTNYTNIRIPIASTNKALYIVHIDHGNSWFGTNPRIYVPGDSNTKYYQLSPTTIGKFGMAIKGRAQFREPRGIYLPAEVVQRGTVRDHNRALQLQIRVDTRNAWNTALHTRGWYSEQVEPL